MAPLRASSLFLRGGALHMVLRLLAVCIAVWGIGNSRGGQGDEGAFKTQAAQREAAAGAGSFEEGGNLRHHWEREVTDPLDVHRSAAETSHVEYQGVSVPATRLRCYDLVLQSMRTEQSTEARVVPRMPTALECCLDGPQGQAALKEQEQIGQCASLRRHAGGRGGLADVHQQGPMGHIDANYTSCFEESGHSPDSAEQGSRFEPAIPAHSFGTHGRGAQARATHGGGGEDLVPSQRAQRHEDSLDRRVGFAARDVGGQGEGFDVQQGTQPRTFEQAQQDQVSAYSAGQKDQQFRSGMEQLCSVNHEEDCLAFRFISAMSRRPHGALQSKTRGPATPEGRVITSLSESPGPATKGTASPGASGDCSADGDHADCIISGRPSDTDGRLGGGRRRGLGDARQPRCRGSPGHQKVQSDSVQRCIISSKGGKSPPEGEERQGEDQRWEGDERDLMNFSTWISWHNVGQRLADVGCGQDASRSLVYRNSQDCHELSHITRGVEQHDRATRETQEQQLVDTCGDEAPDELTYCSGTGPSTAWCSIHLRFEGDHGHPHDSNNSHDSCALVTGASQQWSTDRAKSNFQCLVKVLKQACEAWDDFWQAPSGWTSSPPLEMSATKATLLRSRREGNLDLPLFQGSHGKESEPLDWSDGTSFARYEPCGYGWMPSDGSSITRSNESFSWISQCDRGGDSDSCSQGYTAIFFRTHQIFLKHRMKSVTFRDFVDGHLYQDGQHVTIMLDAVDEEDILRLFWHIDEQIMAWSDIQSALSSLHDVGNAHSVQHEGGSSAWQSIGRTGAARQSFSQSNSHSMWWPVVLCRCATPQSGNPTFVLVDGWQVQKLLCVVSFQEHDGLHTLTTLEGMDMVLANFVKGGMHFLEDDGPTDDEQASDAFTTEPASDGDCSNEASQQTDDELAARALPRDPQGAMVSQKAATWMRETLAASLFL